MLARLEEDLHVLIGLLETGDQGAQTPLAEL